MKKTHVKTHEKRQGRENKIFKKFCQIITACRIELRVQEMTMNKKLTMIGLISSNFLCIFIQHIKTIQIF